MAGKVALDQRFQPVERHAFDGQLVEQAAELARQRQRLGGRLGDRMTLVVGEGADQCRQEGVAFGGFDGRRQAERIAVPRGQLPLAIVDVAQRRQPRQYGGLAAAGAQEGFAQGPHRAAGRHQDQQIGERQRVAAMFRQHPRRQRVGEATVYGDGEDAAHPCRCRSTAARACGVPIWNQSPS